MKPTLNLTYTEKTNADASRHVIEAAQRGVAIAQRNLSAAKAHLAKVKKANT